MRKFKIFLKKYEFFLNFDIFQVSHILNKDLWKLTLDFRALPKRSNLSSHKKRQPYILADTHLKNPAKITDRYALPASNIIWIISQTVIIFTRTLPGELEKMKYMYNWIMMYFYVV